MKIDGANFIEPYVFKNYPVYPVVVTNIQLWFVEKLFMKVIPSDPYSYDN